MLDGRDISQLSLDDLRSKITIILQDACLFAGTLREVIVRLFRILTHLDNTLINNFIDVCNYAL